MESYIGTIMPFPYSYAPNRWMACDGQLLTIAEHNTLFSLIGTHYGGNGKTNFALPNLNGANGAAKRVAAGQGNGPGLTPRTLGQAFGEDAVALTEEQIASHDHRFYTYTSGGATSVPAAGQTLIDPASNGYVDALPSDATTFHPQTILPAGGGRGHPNDQPTLEFWFCICVVGITPAFD